MKRLICLLRGHSPIFEIQCSNPRIVRSYITECRRCRRVYEAVAKP